MRRLLLVPAVALVLIGSPVLALQEPAPPTANVQDVPLAPDQSVEPGWESPETPVDAGMVGVTWEGDAEAEFTIEAQSADGTWSAAASLDASDLSADEGTLDAAPVAAAAQMDNATEPVWIGDDATAVRVTLDEGTATDVTVAAVVDTAAPAPDGAAGALSDVIGPLDGSDKWVFGAVLGALVALLVALALGWKPWRTGRRARLVALVAAAVLLAACTPVTQPPPPPASGSPSPAKPGSSGYPAKPAMHTRSEWGARAFGCGAPELASSLKFASVHHTVNSNTYSAAQSDGIVRSIQAYHMDTLGYCDIAYNFLVDRYGRIFEGRAGGVTKPVIAAHTGGFNTKSTGVALIGDFTGAQPTGDQWNSLVNVLRWRLSIANINPSAGFSTTAASSSCGCVRWAPGTVVSFPNALQSHRDFDTTACPGNAFYPRMNELRNVVQLGISFPSATPPPPPATTTTTTTLAI